MAQIRKWYSVYDAKTGVLVVAGPSEAVADILGYSSVKCFYSAIHHSKERKRNLKYIFESDTISLDEYHKALWEYRHRKSDKKKQERN